MLGANPLVSNGSLLTAPDMRGRLRAIRERGGKVVVVDPRRTRTAEEADEHHFIRPGRDAHLLLAAIACTLVEEDLDRAGPRWPSTSTGLETVRELVRDFPPERVAERVRHRRPRRSGAWRASWRRPSAPRSTRGSAPARRSSARSRAGSSTCSTC